MSSLEDGFGGGVDDIVSANAGEPFWEVGYHVFPSVPIAKFSRCHGANLQMNGTNSATPQLGFSNYTMGHLALLRHVAAATPSRSHLLHESRTFAE